MKSAFLSHCHRRCIELFSPYLSPSLISFSDRYTPNFLITDYLVLTVEKTPLKRTWLSPLGLDSLVTPLLNTETILLPESNDKHMNSYLTADTVGSARENINDLCFMLV